MNTIYIYDQNDGILLLASTWPWKSLVNMRRDKSKYQ